MRPYGLAPPRLTVAVTTDTKKAKLPSATAPATTEPAAPEFETVHQVTRIAFGATTEDTPEISIAVDPGHRGRGVGTGLLDALCECLRHYRDQRRALGLPQQVPQADLGGGAVHPVNALWRVHLVGKGLQSLAIDHQYKAGLARPAGLVEQAPQQELGCAHSPSSSRTSAILIVPSRRCDSACRARARKSDTASGLPGSSRIFSSTLGVAGCILQSVARNPLASPDTLAVDAGAYLTVVTVAAFGITLPFIAGGMVAFVGGLLGAAFKDGDVLLDAVIVDSEIFLIEVSD